MRILHIIDTLDEHHSSRQIPVISSALTCDATIEVCCLGNATGLAEAMPHSAIKVHALGWRRWLDAAALWRLRRIVLAGDYHVLHVWGLAALRAVASAAPGTLPRVIAGALPDPRRLGWVDRYVVQRVRWVPADEMPTAVSSRPSETARWAAQYPLRIACAGRLERSAGFREAIWAIDVLRYVFPDVHLLIAGTGPFRPNLDDMIERLHIDNAHLLGDAVEPEELYAAADVCWVPSLTDGDRHAALAAMASGHPVIASNVAPLNTLIRAGVTGYLVPPGEPVALARRTRALLQNPAERHCLGDAARADVLGRCAVDRVAAAWQRLYNEVAA